MHNSDNRQVGPDRVWVKNERTPGLAMSRSIGESVAHPVGVISKPEVFTTKLTKEDAFAFLATDGLWESMNSQTAVEIVGGCLENGDTENVCARLIDHTAKAGPTDDTTVIVVFFK